MKYRDFLLLMTGLIIPTYKVLSWFNGMFGKLLKKLFKRIEKDLIIWTHYKKYAQRKGHKSHLRVCIEDRCIKI